MLGSKSESAPTAKKQQLLLGTYGKPAEQYVNTIAKSLRPRKSPTYVGWSISIIADFESKICTSNEEQQRLFAT